MEINPHERLRLYCEQFTHLPKQGSGEWLLQREKIIGGSEIPTILGNNSYKNLESFYEQKLGIKPFRGNICTQWGSIFENVVVYILGLDYGKIYSLGSIDGMQKDGVTIQSFSPDGLVVIDDKIVLLEIKSPYSRIPDGDVPSNYEDQVQVGLHTINVADRALFVDACFRTCAYNQLDIAGCDRNLPSRNPPIMTGFLLEYSTYWDQEKNIYITLRELAGRECVSIDDIRSANLGIYEPFAIKYICERKGQHYTNDDLYMKCIMPKCVGDNLVISVGGSDELHAAMKQLIREHKTVINIIPWKLYYLEKKWVEKKEGYLEEIRPIVESVHNELMLRFKALSEQELSLSDSESLELY